MFFQNVFDSEFVGSMVYADRQYNLTFKVPANKNRQDLMICWNQGPFNLVGNNTFTINFSLDAGVYYSAIAVTLTSGSAVTAESIVDTLNADDNFSAWYEAQVFNNYRQIAIKPRKTKLAMKTYITNTSAETILRFNKQAGVAELPSYYVRHQINNAPTYPDSVGMLVRLDETDPVDQDIIEEAGFTPGDMLEDWELLSGRAESFMFTINSYDGSNRLEEVLTFPAGSVAGDLAKLTQYTYDGVSSRIVNTTEVPHVLTSGEVASIIPP